MAKTKPTCFISYCHADVHRDTLQKFEELLTEYSENYIEFIRDVQNPPGGNWDKFMSLVASVDAAIVLLTPEYKKRVLTKTGGVYEEFRQLYTRLVQTREAREHASFPAEPPIRSFALIPLIFGGAPDDAVPSEISRENYQDFTHFHVAKDIHNNQIIVADGVKLRFVPEIKKIISAIDATIIENIPDFQFAKGKYFDALIVDTKDENLIRKLSLQKRKYIFVKTKSFGEINRYKSFIIVGRKGSGKSTITRYITDQERDRYKTRIHFYVDDVNLDTLFALEEFSLEKFASDTKVIKQQAELMKIVWQLFMYYACCTIIYMESNAGILDSAQALRANRICHFIRKLDAEIKYVQDDGFDHWALFVYCFERVLQYIDRAVAEASNSDDKFLASLLAATGSSKIVDRCFPKTVHKSLEDLAAHCKRRFMFSFDGFDTKYEKFRADTLLLSDPSLINFRVNFEIDWIRGLIHLVYDIRNGRLKENISNIIDFYLTTPKDRFFEIKESERDAYIYRGRYSMIAWTAIELLIMLRKRLEIMNDKTTKVGDEIERYYNFMQKFYPEFPKYIDIVHQKRKYRFETIFYVIRHTFWRPRDVLFYMAELLARLEECKNCRWPFTAEIIKTCISNTTYEIIRSEFIGELRSTCPNIEYVIKSFENSKQILSFDEVSKILSKVELGFVSYVVKKYDTVVEKIKFLYEIGFLGFGLSDRLRTQFRMETGEVFSFSDGERIIELANTNEYKSFKYIIHPIFCEFLRLDTTENEIVLRYTPTYIKLNDIHDNR